MEIKHLTCREHGGTFSVPAARGRPPVRCGGKYPECVVTRARKAAPVKVSPAVRTNATKATNGKAQRDAAVIKAAVQRAVKTTPVPATLTRTAKPASERLIPSGYERAEQEAPRKPRAKAPVSAVRDTDAINPSVAKAHQAKGELEPLGWHVTGRATGSEASITATRDQEMIHIVWVDGELKSQNYTLWDTQRPALNLKGMPARKLEFNPDEMPDRELINVLSGMKITWWNRLAKATETAVIPGHREAKVTIEHVYGHLGDEMPGDRIVKFVDVNGTGYRAFHVAALIKVG